MQERFFVRKVLPFLIVVPYLLVTGFILLLTSTMTNENLNRYAGTPEHPANVPDRAVWAGGFSGGKFIYCDAIVGNRDNHCTIYADVSGVIFAEADFHLKDENRAASKDELRYSGFNGQVIALKDGKVLVPEKPIIHHVEKGPS